jgi:hypothetical protein
MRNILAALVLVLAFVPGGASACSCVPPGSVQEETARSTRAFAGRVTNIEERSQEMYSGWLSSAIQWIKGLFGVPAPPDHQFYPHMLVTFQILETFKGPKASDVQLSTGMGGGDCGYLFETGKTYVVYAHGVEGDLGAGICSLTGPASDPRSGLSVLRNGS